MERRRRNENKNNSTYISTVTQINFSFRQQCVINYVIKLFYKKNKVFGITYLLLNVISAFYTTF